MTTFFPRTALTAGLLLTLLALAGCAKEAGTPAAADPGHGEAGHSDEAAHDEDAHDESAPETTTITAAMAEQAGIRVARSQRAPSPTSTTCRAC